MTNNSESTTAPEKILDRLEAGETVTLEDARTRFHIRLVGGPFTAAHGQFVQHQMAGCVCRPADWFARTAKEPSASAAVAAADLA
jgi:type II secretory pathway predicted ATPase ExeA